LLYNEGKITLLIFAKILKSAFLLLYIISFFGLAMWRKFSTNVDAENQTLFNHKCVCGELNRHIAKPMLVAVNLSLL
jgi:hypothetical protein